LISEHEFANSFDAFWEGLFPLLSPSFIRDFNRKQIKRIRYGPQSPLRAIPIVTAKEHADVVTELAFEMFRFTYERGLPSHQWQISSDDFEPAKKAVAVRFVGLKNHVDLMPLMSSRIVENEVKSLVGVYFRFFSTFKAAERLIFRPKINGAGIIRMVEGDICTPETLIEVKTVNRNLTTTDFRQLLVYLALGLGAGQYSWHDAVFLNPRRATFYSFEVATLVEYLSARNVSDVFDEFIYFLSEREMDLEPAF
jgi:hypothetical protein